MNKNELSQLRFLRHALHQANFELKVSHDKYGMDSEQYAACLYMQTIDRAAVETFTLRKIGVRRV